MAHPIVRVRVRVGVNEAEIEAPPDRIKEIISLVPDVIKILPSSSEVSSGRALAVLEGKPRIPGTELPEIRIEKDDSLSDVITKIFVDPWGKQPRRLSDIRRVLESYGMVYPKQSVAVALLRLAQSGKLRRFKGEGGDFVYTASIAISGGEAADGIAEEIKEVG